MSNSSICSVSFWIRISSILILWPFSRLFAQVKRPSAAPAIYFLTESFFIYSCHSPAFTLHKNISEFIRFLYLHWFLWYSFFENFRCQSQIIHELICKCCSVWSGNEGSDCGCCPLFWGKFRSFYFFIFLHVYFSPSRILNILLPVVPYCGNDQ